MVLIGKWKRRAVPKGGPNRLRSVVVSAARPGAGRYLQCELTIRANCTALERAHERCMDGPDGMAQSSRPRNTSYTSLATLDTRAGVHLGNTDPVLQCPSPRPPPGSSTPMDCTQEIPGQDAHPGNGTNSPGRFRTGTPHAPSQTSVPLGHTPSTDTPLMSGTPPKR